MSYTNGLDNPELYFQIALYTGNYSTQTITLPGSEDMQPDMIWIKERTGTSSHALQDSVRGTGSKIMPNASDAESTGETAYITSFNSDGFSIGANNGINQDGILNVAWCWKESATAGFDIVTYTGNGSARTISHSLSAVPHLMIQKKLSGSAAWTVYHHKMASDPETDYLYLSTTAAVADYNLHWNDTAPTSSVFTLGTDTSVNGSSATNVMYLFTAKQGFSKFGKFTGNGNVDGTFVYTGFRPAMVMCKRTDSTGSWYICDIKRVGFNGRPNNTASVGNPELAAQSDRSEAGGNTNVMDIFSNGFKLIQSGAEINASGGTFIFMAFAEAPFVNSNGVPCNAR